TGPTRARFFHSGSSDGTLASAGANRSWQGARRGGAGPVPRNARGRAARVPAKLLRVRNPQALRRYTAHSGPGRRHEGPPAANPAATARAVTQPPRGAWI